jgi:RNA polymerase sigma-70 factor (ECF subfamily)
MNEHEVDFEALRQRDSTEVERWFRAHADLVYTFAYYRTRGDRDLACDVVQETFATALARLEEFDPGRGSMRVWLSFLARNCLRTARRKARPFAAERSELNDASIADAIGSIDHAELPDEVIAREETAELVREALSTLSPLHQHVLVERYWRQRPLAEVADELEITEGAVKGRLHRARLAFKDEIQRLARANGYRDLAREASP